MESVYLNMIELKSLPTFLYLLIKNCEEFYELSDF